MNLRKAVAVAALAVVGVVGLVSAQTWPLSLSGNNKLTGDKAVDRAEMEVTHTVELYADMVSYGNGKTGVELKDISYYDLDPSDDDYIYAPPADGTQLMEFGLLQVSTNYPFWDIEFTTRNGGRLTTKGGDTVVCKMEPQGSFPNVVMVEVCDSVAKAGAYLKYNSGVDTVQLVVAIGVVDMADQTDPGALAHTVVRSDSLKLTGVPTRRPLSFVDIFTGARDSASIALFGTTTGPVDVNQDYTVGGRVLASTNLAERCSDPSITTGQTDCEAATNIWLPAATSAAGRGFGSTELTLNSGTNPKVSELLYVSARLDKETFANIAGNPEGEYSETFTFTMYANY